MLNFLREKIKTAQDKDVEDKKGTQPKRYYAKDAEGDEMSKSTKDDRAAHFAKNSKKADDDDSAYKPAPGDASAKTKPSKYTKAFKKEFGEDSELEERYADKMRAKTKSQQNAHQKAMMKSARKSIKDYDTKKALSKIRGLTKDQLAVLSAMNPTTLTTVLNQLSTLMMGEELEEAMKGSERSYLEKRHKMLDQLQDKIIRMRDLDRDLKQKANKAVGQARFAIEDLLDADDMGESIEIEEGKYVAGVYEILSTLTSKFKKEAGERYQKNSERGLAFINQLAKMVGASVTDKKQQKGKLFMKNEYEINEDATATAELKAKHTDEIESLKQKHMDELEALKDRHQREVERQNNLNDKEKQDDQIQKQRDADRKSSERERRNQREDRNYKKEYENYHSDPEQIKRRAQRNKARRLLKAVKNEKELRGKDVHHKDGNPNNNDKKNLSVVTQNYNRKEPRLR